MSQVEDLLSEIRGTWENDDPLVLRYDDKNETIVAVIDGEVRAYNSGLVFPAVVTKDSLLNFTRRYGSPQIDTLSNHTDRFTKEMFEWEFPQST